MFDFDEQMNGLKISDNESEIIFVEKCEKIPFTNERLLSNVTPSMCRNITFDCKSFLTNITSIGTFTSVYTLVSIQTALLSETFKTQFTLERSLASVGSHVNLEVRLPAEAGFTHRTMIRLIARVQFHVNIV